MKTSPLNTPASTPSPEHPPKTYKPTKRIVSISIDLPLYDLLTSRALESDMFLSPFLVSLIKKALKIK